MKNCWPSGARRSESPHMKIITINVPRKDITRFEQIIESGLYTNRSEAVRDAIRDVLLLPDDEMKQFMDEADRSGEMKSIITLNLPTTFVNAIFHYTTMGIGYNRSDFIRACIGRFFDVEKGLLERQSTFDVEPEIEPPAMPRPLRVDMRTCRRGWNR